MVCHSLLSLFLTKSKDLSLTLSSFSEPYARHQPVAQSHGFHRWGYSSSRAFKALAELHVLRAKSMLEFVPRVLYS